MMPGDEHQTFRDMSSTGKPGKSTKRVLYLAENHQSRRQKKKKNCAHGGPIVPVVEPPQIQAGDEIKAFLNVLWLSSRKLSDQHAHRKPSDWAAEPTVTTAVVD